jgi:nicotinamide-nucleotide amidase
LFFITRLAVWEGEEERVVRQRLYKTTGLSETAINKRLDGLAGETAGVRLGYYPVFPEVHVSLTVGEKDDASAMRILQGMDDAVVRLLGTHLYGTDDDTLEGVVGSLLVEYGRTIAVAESCTGGLIGQRITSKAGSSRYFTGGVVAYGNEMKQRVLGVDAGLLDRHGAVSSPVAQAMAEGARKVCRADMGLSVTGIAGPSGGSPEKPVGTVFIGMAVAEGVRSYQYTFAGSRWQIQERTAQEALDVVRRFLLDNAGHAKQY